MKQIIPIRTARRITTLSLAAGWLLGCDLTGSNPAASRVTLQVQPEAPAPSGKAFAVQPVVRLVDALGRPVRQAGIEITAALASGPDPSATIDNRRVLTNAEGQAAFRAMAITGTQGSYRLSFAGPGLTPDLSNGVTVSAPLSGTAIDPVGDMPVLGADLVAATLTVVRGDSLFISVRWAPGGFVRDTSHAVVHLDIDQNSATGHPGINSTGTVDAGRIGSEFLVLLGASQDAVHDDLRLYHYEGPVGRFSERNLVNSVRYVADGMEAMISLTVLGPEDGLMDFKLVSTLKVDATGFTGWLDVMPDVGQPGVAVRSAQGGSLSAATAAEGPARDGCRAVPSSPRRTACR